MAADPDGNVQVLSAVEALAEVGPNLGQATGGPHRREPLRRVTRLLDSRGLSGEDVER